MNWIKNEWVYFWTSLMFFTRIPVPFKLPYNAEIMEQSQKYYAWVGLFVGTLNALLFILFSWLLPLSISILLTMIASILLTGAFHEDGFTDVCDGFGGGYGKEKIMTIMKDSRIGAYGTIGIVLLLLLKFYTLLELSFISNKKFLIFSFIYAHALSRYISGTTIYTHKYVTDIDVSKSKPLASKALPYSTLLVGLFAVLVPFFVFKEVIFLLCIPVAYLAKVYLSNYFKRQIGGFTGDCLGTIQQVCEVIIYLTLLVLWKFI